MTLVEQLRGLVSSGIKRPGELMDEAADEITRLNAALQWEQNRSERIGTHWDGCHLAGHQHYECLLRENARLTAELADYRKALEVRNKQLGVACMKHDLVHSLACGICLTETRDLAEHWAILAEQRRVELGECMKELEEREKAAYIKGSNDCHDAILGAKAMSSKGAKT